MILMLPLLAALAAYDLAGCPRATPQATMGALEVECLVGPPLPLPGLRHPVIFNINLTKV